MKTITAVLVALMACGCGKQEESIAKRAGDKVGETLTDFASGVGQGVDQRMSVDVKLSEEMTKRGLSKTVSKSRGLDSKIKGMTVYFISTNAFKGKLEAKAMNKEGQEIGRSVVDAEFSDDDAKYVSFTFDDEMDARLVREYVVDIKK